MNNNQMPILTEEQRAAEIEQTKELRNHLNFWGHASGFDAEFLMRVTDAYLAMLTAKPFMYGIMDADGGAHMDECCVSTSLAGVSDSIDVLNEELTEEGDPQYKPVALFTTPPVLTLDERLYRLANHIASAKNGLPEGWQDWAEEIESDLRLYGVGHEIKQPVKMPQRIANIDLRTPLEVEDMWRDRLVSAVKAAGGQMEGENAKAE